VTSFGRYSGLENESGMSPTLYGVIPVLATPFDERGRVDIQSQVRLVRHLLDSGVHGLCLFANAAEGYTLRASERRELQELILGEVSGRVPVVVACSGTAAALVLDQCLEAESLGASALMVLPPYYVKPDAGGLYRFLKEIHDHVQLPLVIQDVPHLTQVSIGGDLLERIAGELPRVEYVKLEAAPTAPKVTAIVRQTGGRLRVLGGLNGQFMLEELDRGAVGIMPNSDLTAYFVHIYELWSQGCKDQAWDWFAHILPLLRFELQPNLGVSAMKHGLVEAGLISTATVREPTGQLDAKGLEELRFLRRRVLRKVPPNRKPSGGRAQETGHEPRG